MKKRTLCVRATVAALGLLGVALAGCNNSTEMSKEEQSNFKGGPMPKGFNANQPAGPGAPAAPAAPVAAPAPK